MDAEQIHEAACRAGATVMGEPEGTQHYIMNAAELVRFVALATAIIPVCPVPRPQENANLVQGV